MAEYKEYTIQKGDNLTKIAKEFNTTVDELVKINGIKDKNVINAGATLKVPVAVPVTTTGAGGYKTYTIVKGDNLTKIAKEFGTTVDELVKLKDPNLIYAGAELKIPGGAGAATAAPTAATTSTTTTTVKNGETVVSTQTAEEKKAAIEEAKKQFQEKLAEKEKEDNSLKSKLSNLFKKKDK